MLELVYLGISDDEFNQILEINPNVKNMTNEDIKNKLDILRTVKCSDKNICNIITYNPLFFNLSDDDVISLIGYLTHKGFKCLNILFDSNPNILNMGVDEIDTYIAGRVEDGEELASVVDELDSNPILFDEI